MITEKSLGRLELFASLEPLQRERLASKAADIKLKQGEWLAREGERLQFCVVLSGVLELKKEVMGLEVHIAEFAAGDFFGEVSALFGIPAMSSLRAKTTCRVARFEDQQLQELVKGPTHCGDIILSALKSRLEDGPRHVMELPTARVRVAASSKHRERGEIRSFLRLNRIPHQWIDRNTESSGAAEPQNDLAVFVDDLPVPNPPTPRNVAEALGISTRPIKQRYDVLIVGGGPAGLAAAVYGSSEGLSVLLVERRAMGGQAGTSARIENYLGFPNGISGDELSERAVKQAKRFGAELILMRQVLDIVPLRAGGYQVKLDDEEHVEAITIILTTGVEWRRPEGEGIRRLIGKGVFYGSVTSDPATLIGKKVFIVGGGNSAGQAAMALANYARHVTILVRSSTLEFSMSRYQIDQLGCKSNVKVEICTELVSVSGRGCLQSIRTVHAGEEPIDRRADALYVMIGADAATDWLPKTLQRDQDGFICTGRDVSDFSSWGESRSPFLLETNLPGLFCAGDVRHGSIKRVSSAVGEGSMAINSVHQVLASQCEVVQSAALGSLSHPGGHNKMTRIPTNTN